MLSFASQCTPYIWYVYILCIQWSPSNPDTAGTQCLWLDYRGTRFSGVIGTTWVWLNAISNDVM